MCAFSFLWMGKLQVRFYSQHYKTQIWSWLSFLHLALTQLLKLLCHPHPPPPHSASSYPYSSVNLPVSSLPALHTPVYSCRQLTLTFSPFQPYHCPLYVHLQLPVRTALCSWRAPQYEYSAEYCRYLLCFCSTISQGLAHDGCHMLSHLARCHFLWCLLYCQKKKKENI